MNKWPLALLLLASPAPGQDAPVLVVTDGDRPIATVTLPDAASGSYTVSIRYPAAGRRPHPAPKPVPPPPAPEPPPGPPAPPSPPAPAPVPAFVGHLHATLLHAIDEPSTAPLRVSPIKAHLAALDCDWRWIDPTSPDFARFQPRMKQDGLLDPQGNLAHPVCYVTDAKGDVKAVIPAPTAEADVLSRVTILRGLGK